MKEGRKKSKTVQHLSVTMEWVMLNVKRFKGVYSWLTESHSYGMSLAIWVTQCYLPPDTSKRAPS